MAECTTQRGNTGLQTCSANMGMIDLLVLVPVGHYFADETAALLLSNWITGINEDPAVRFYPLPRIFNTEDQSEEPVRETGQEGKTEMVRDGKEIYTFMLENMSTYNYRELRKHNNKKAYSAYVFTSNGYLKANSSDGTKVEARPLSDFRVNKLKAQGTDTLQRVSIYVEFDGSDTYHDLGVDLKPTWVPQNELVGIKDVKLTVSGQTTTALTVAVTGYTDGLGVEGLVTADFTFLKGVAPVVVTATEVGDGVYTLAYTTTAGAHTLDLKNQPAMDTNFFESVASVAVTIS